MRPPVKASTFAVMLFVTVLSASAQSRWAGDRLFYDFPDYVSSPSSAKHDNGQSVRPVSFTRADALASLRFEANQGQAPASVRYLARTRKNLVLLTNKGATLVTGSESADEDSNVVELRFAGGSNNPTIEAEFPLRGRVNYLIGSSAEGWYTNIPTYGRVRYRDVYPGIDIVFRSGGQSLEYDFEIAPGGKVSDIRIGFEGATLLRLSNGSLDVDGVLSQPAPRIFQLRGDVHVSVDGRYALRDDGTVGFEVAQFDASLPLIIDPVVEFSTFLGGQADDGGLAVTVGPDGSAYVTGTTRSTDFPTVHPHQPDFSDGLTDAFVAKLTPDGSELEFATYLGGSRTDIANGIAIDSNGEILIAGATTSSADFPVFRAMQSLYGGGLSDGFVTRLSADGAALDYSTFLGGSRADGVHGIATDSSGSAYVAGFTASRDFPVINAVQSTFGGGLTDAFVAKVKPGGDELDYATYIGGSRADSASGVAVDAFGNALIAGNTVSYSDFPTVNAYQSTFGGGIADGFVLKLASDGSGPFFSTYFGGSKLDIVSAIATDADGNAYITGSTLSSAGFPLRNALQDLHGGASDAFAARLTSLGGLDYSTYLGGARKDVGRGIAVDRARNVLVTGHTESSSLDGFPILNAVQPELAGEKDAFVLKLTSNGGELEYSTYLGGSLNDKGTGVAADSEGNAVVTGRTYSLIDFPMVQALQHFASGYGADAFVAKIRSNTAPFFTTLPSTTVVRVGDSFDYDADANDLDGDTLVFSLIDSPTGMTINSATGLIRWSPSVEDVPIQPVVVAVLDGRGGEASQAFDITVISDLVPPEINITSPEDGALTRDSAVTITGFLDEEATLLINGAEVPVATDLSFVFGPTPLQEGDNFFTVVAEDLFGNVATSQLRVIRDSVPPAPINVNALTLSEPQGGAVDVTGSAGSVEPLTTVEITHSASGEVAPVPANFEGAFSTRLSAQPGESLLFVVIDAAGNRSPQVRVAAHGTAGLPPDPTIVAPKVVDKGVASMQSLTEFLYTGDSPIQTGVAPDTIQAHRVGVIRGRVTNRDGSLIPGVKVSIKDHPEFGETLSRTDGQFDIAVNGGGVLVINYEKPGYLPLQRRVNVPWQDFSFADDVVMTQLDTNFGLVNLDSNVPVQVVRGRQESDADGPRQATVMFNQGTSATMVLPDGTTQPLSSLRVRATEYTVGPNGPRAMPAKLPPSSGYTYAVELSVDEAFTAGATQVTFDRPVYLYVENFLGFPVGTAAPIGYYDRVKALWVPSPDGRVIEIMSVEGGIAEIDIDGTGISADAVALADLGVTDAEREHLASIYAPGQSLWRAPITHFSPYDINWPMGQLRTIVSRAAPGPGTGPGLGGANLNGGAGNGDNKLDTYSCLRGSVIETENQIVGETIPVVGVPYTLNYRSDRVRGRKLAYALGIRLTGESIPEELQRVNLEVWVAGRRFIYGFAPAPNLDFTFEWDGLDAYGREVRGQRAALVTIGYSYPQTYFSVPLNTAFSGASSFGAAAPPGATTVTVTRVGSSVLLETTWTSALGTWDARSVGLGAWTFDVHHQYDPAGATLYLGDGRRRRAERIGPVISTVRNMTPQRARPRGVAVAPDGSVYVAESGTNIISVTSPDGVTTTVVGGGNPADGVGDGGPATSARLDTPSGLALGSDGALYISERGGVGPQRVRRVDPNGIIETVAGSGPRGFSGDGGPAVNARLNNPNGLAVGPDGSLYIADVGNARVRRVTVDGTITTVAGDGSFGYLGDGSLAIETGVNIRLGLAVDGDGIVYVADQLFIRRIHPDGIVDTLGAIPGIGLKGVAGLDVDRNGGVYGTTVGGTDKLFHVNAEGIGTILSLDFDTNFCGAFLNFCSIGDGGLSTAATQFNPWGVGLAPDNSLYVANSGASDRFHFLRRVSSPLPGFSLADTFIASEDGERLFQFDSFGRHLRTFHSLTGAVMVEFSYDADGLLFQITDGDNNVTTVERDGSGEPMALVSPDGHRTALSLDTKEYLATVTNPAAETHRMTYTSDGLLNNFTNPRNFTSSFNYDALGRLERDRDPLGGGWRLAHTGSENNFAMPVTTGENRASSFEIQRAIAQNEIRISTSADGTVTETIITSAGDEISTSPDGQVVRIQKAPDRRFGMQSPLNASTLISMPSGLAFEATTASNVLLGNPSDNLSVSLTQDFLTVNGRQFSSVFDGLSKKFTVTTPAGRRSERVIDAQGRAVREVFPGQSPIDYVYDSRGRLQKITQGTGIQIRTTTLTYNDAGFLDTVTDALNRSVRFEYDDAGRVIAQTQPGNHRIEFGYDGNGNIASIKPAGRPTHSFEYTAVDQESVYTPPAVFGADSSTRRFYNVDRELILEERPDLRSVNFVYNDAGQVRQVVASRGTYDLAYDSVTGQLTRMVAPDGGVLSRSYDGSLVTESSWNGNGTISGTVGRTFDSDFRIATESVNGIHSVSFTYDGDSLVKSAGPMNFSRDPLHGKVIATALSNVSTSKGYNTFGELEFESATVMESTVYEVAYDRDNLGRIIRKTELMEGESSVVDYSYDISGRLQTVTSDDGVEIARYVYDSNGNRTGGFNRGQSIVASYDTQDRLNSYNEITYTYSANGELRTKVDSVTGNITQFSYDEFGSLTSVSLHDGTLIEYVIDARNRRIGKIIDGVIQQGFLFRDQLNPVAELDGDGNVISRFVYGDKPHVPAFMERDGQTYLIVSDHLGSVRLVIDAADGDVVQRMDFDEYGRVLLDTNPGFQPFGFAGGLYDTDTGLTRFGARDYDSEIGRWTTKDPIKFDAGGNLYEYVHGSPISMFDPTGLWAWGDPLAQGIVDVAAGFGDGISTIFTFGLYSTADLREDLNIGGGVDDCSVAYRLSSYTGYAWGIGTAWAAGLNGGANSVFWSGHGARVAASSLGTTINKTIIGRALASFGSHVPRFVWQVASATFAANAKGVAKAVIRYNNPRSIWLTIEKRILDWRSIPIRYSP